ncbi:MAG: SDR family NAD(P)-dependent oxidoreductase [Hyphomicrobiales bacterium]|nr:SDR family NAD(P)-dependent oxidoreductase [Hyphomicrobiales bacterium]
MAKSVIWITGAGKGIGRALALELSARGNTIAASARTAEDLATLAAEAGTQGGPIHAYPLDVTDSEAVAQIAARIARELGPPDLVVLNAGTHAETSAARFDLAAFRQVIETNIMGAANCLSALLPGMMERGGGRVALVASVAGYRGLPGAGAYGASKAALIALGEALKPELEKSGVELSLINPGFVDTPLTRRNTFPMPFLMEPGKAARIIADGLEKHRFEIVFPWQMTLLMKLLGILPYPLFFAVTRRMVRD